ncbi:MAG: site-2 protease family protein [Chloroflexi bacterium]|nr:site-2 protease family protein [Chloroflexota bacterium]
MFLTIGAFLLVLFIVVLAHEIGHYATAKLFGVRVLEFGFGYPPRIASVKYGDTDYSLNLLPLGGFVKLSGEEDPKAKDSLAGKGYGTRLLVLAAGSIMNALLPLLLFSIAYMVPHDMIEGSVLIDDVSANSPAAAAGILPGDTVLEVEGHQINSTNDIGRYIQLNLGNETTFLLERADGAIEEVMLVPRWDPPAEEGSAGVVVSNVDPVIVSESLPFFKAIGTGINQTGETMVLFKNALLGLVTGTAEFNIAGPVGIAELTGQFAEAGLSPLLEFTAFFSINLAIVNLLPLPALDGGRIAFVLVEWARRGKRVDPKTEGKIHLVGFLLLIGFMVAVTFQDIINIVSG